MMVRDWPAATASYNRALEIAPDSAQTLIGLAYLELFRNGNPAAAQAILRRIPAGVDPGRKRERSTVGLEHGGERFRGSR